MCIHKNFALQCFAFGQQNRATAATNMNEHSSRSHALLCVTVEGVNKTTQQKTLGMQFIVHVNVFSCLHGLDNAIPN